MGSMAGELWKGLNGRDIVPTGAEAYAAAGASKDPVDPSAMSGGRGDEKKGVDGFTDYLEKKLGESAVEDTENMKLGEGREGDQTLSTDVAAAITGASAADRTSASTKTWKRMAKEEADEVRLAIDELRTAAALGVNAPTKAIVAGQRVQGKLAFLQASVADVMSLASYPCTSVFGKISSTDLGAATTSYHTSMSRVRSGHNWRGCRPVINSTLLRRSGRCSGSTLRSRSWTLRAQGIYPVTWLSGNVPLDQMNVILADLYFSIGCLFLHRRTLLSFCGVSGANDGTDDTEKDLKSAIAILRTAGLRIRVDIAKLGGIPLNEPLACWREKFYISQF